MAIWRPDFCAPGFLPCEFRVQANPDDNECWGSVHTLISARRICPMHRSLRLNSVEQILEAAKRTSRAKEGARRAMARELGLPPSQVPYLVEDDGAIIVGVDMLRRVLMPWKAARENPTRRNAISASVAREIALAGFAPCMATVRLA